MQNKYKISVIISMYNKQYYIARAIESVLNQSYPVFEIIIVDDCSTDGSIAAASQIKDARIKIIKTPANSGQGAANNIGIDAATGDWVAFLDGDDYWLPEKIQKQIDFYNLHAKNPNMIASRVIIRGPNSDSKKIRPTKTISQNNNKILKYLTCSRGVMQMSTIIVKTEVAKSVRFDQNFKSLTDIIFCLRYEMAGYTAYMHPEALTVWWETEPTVRVSKNTTARSLAFKKFAEIYSSHVSKEAHLGLLVRYSNNRPHGFLERIAYLRLIMKALFSGAVSIFEFLVIYFPRVLLLKRQ